MNPQTAFIIFGLIFTAPAGLPLVTPEGLARFTLEPNMENVQVANCKTSRVEVLGAGRVWVKNEGEPPHEVRLSKRTVKVKHLLETCGEVETF